MSWRSGTLGKPTPSEARTMEEFIAELIARQEHIRKLADEWARDTHATAQAWMWREKARWADSEIEYLSALKFKHVNTAARIETKRRKLNGKSHEAIPPGLAQGLAKDGSAGSS